MTHKPERLGDLGPQRPGESSATFLRCPALFLATLALLLGCGSGVKRTGRYDVDQLNEALKNPEAVGLVLGEFALANEHAIIDGDTIKVKGLRSTLRLLAIDTEETFKKQEERRRFEQGWDSYLAWNKAQSSGPVKIATPLGEQAKAFAQTFFKGVKYVRLERDHPKEIKGRYGRFLTYVFAKRNGSWVNYNVECVRAGMSPYFTKYSYSRRFHKEFVDAQREAREAKRGIWGPGGQHYDDYPRRLAWWNSRADFIQAFERKAATHDNYIVLTHWDALARIKALLDKEVVILATVGGVRWGREGPSRVQLSRRQRSDFPLIFFKKEVLKASHIMAARGDFIEARGKVNVYRRGKRATLQVIVSQVDQIVLPSQNPEVNRRLRPQASPVKQVPPASFEASKIELKAGQAAAGQATP